LDPVDLSTWRATERKLLIAAREALGPAEHRRQDEIVTAALLEAFPCLRGAAIGIYWPMKGEFDPRVAALRLRERGSRIALPAVERKAAPLRFLEWWPGVKTEPGVFNLPVPQDTPDLHPDAVLVPPVGFDAHGYRLGYGGGYFDRTLAALRPRPLAIGVGREASRMETIHPQPHDIPMDFIVTERAVYERTPRGLRAIGPAEAAAAAAAVLESRRPLGTAS
jgi:5-formyltetrahydrofolate cyclo-ligase